MGLSSIDINRYCNPLRKKGLFLGCFPDDKIPESGYNTPYCFIVNTDPSTAPGTHWVAVFVLNPNVVWYFDSLNGVPTESMKLFLNSFSKILINERAYQSIFSELCGHFCIVFLYLAVKYKSYNNIINVFNSLGKNIEKFVSSFVFKVLNIYKR